MSTTTFDSTRDLSQIQIIDVPVRPRTLVTLGVAGLGLAAMASSLSESGSSRLAHAYLTSLCFFLSISLGALFFVVLQHLTAARWSVVVRRIAELLTSPLTVLGLLMLPIAVPMLLGNAALYEWNDATVRQTDSLVQAKAAYLNAPFFALRCSFYFAVWIGLSQYFLRNSVRQDQATEPSASQAMRRYSGPAMIAFALTTNFAAFDWLMSLDPHWFSTIFGVYFFAGCAVSIFAALPIAACLLQRGGYLRTEITKEHYHDLGKLLFGFVFFWAYIAFSQYFLIWYANIPEETNWFYIRQNDGWQNVGFCLIVGHFVLPFFGLMSRSARRDVRQLVFWSVFLLIMHYLDLFWLIMPDFSSTSVLFGSTEILCFFGIAAIWSGALLRAATATRLLPSGDPHLSESLAFHNL